jgi:DNA-binding transcriptional LysR family regulator
VPKDLDGLGFVAFETNIPTRRHIDGLLRQSRISVDVVMEFDNIELLKRAIMVGSGVSILPKANIHDEAARGDLACIPFKNPTRWRRPVGVLRRRGKKPTPAERKFLSILSLSA